VLPRQAAVEGGVVEKPSSAPSAASPPAAPAKQPTLSPEEIALAKKIEARHIGIAREDLFTRLGLQREANGEQVKAAYFSQVKVFHPDRLPSALANLTPKVKDIFAALTEAYETLYDDAKRSMYLMRLAAPSQSQAPKASSLEVTLKQADLHLKKKEFAAAAELFGKAFAESNKALHLAMQAWAMYLDPAQRSNMPQIKAKLEQALRLDRECDRAHYTLGVMARVENDLARAEKFFRAAVAVNPKNAEASTELRLIEMRRKKGGGGFFK
jgi:curved DNA-binding protein CbpA